MEWGGFWIGLGIVVLALAVGHVGDALRRLSIKVVMFNEERGDG